MYLPIACFVGGLILMGRTKPKTPVKKIVCLGPKSGLVYDVEDFREVGSVIVRSPGNRAVVQFLRASTREPGRPGLLFQNGFGDPQAIDTIRADFGLPPAPPRAVAAPADARRETRDAGQKAGPKAVSSKPGEGTP